MYLTRLNCTRKKGQNGKFEANKFTMANNIFMFKKENQ